MDVTESTEFVAEVGTINPSSEFSVDTTEVPQIAIHSPAIPAYQTRFNSREDVRRTVAELQRSRLRQMTPISIHDGKIRLHERAMIPGHAYEIKFGDGTYQFVRRTDGSIAMYELL